MSFIFFTFWVYIIGYPQYYILKFIRSRVRQAVLHNGITLRELTLVTTMFIALSVGVFLRMIYDQFYNDWTSYFIFMIIVYYFTNKYMKQYYAILGERIYNHYNNCIRNEEEPFETYIQDVQYRLND